MPKIREDDLAKRNKILKSLIAKNMVLYGYTNKTELAAAIGVGGRTFYNRYKNPDTFTRRELRRMFEKLHFTQEEKGAVI